MPPIPYTFDEEATNVINSIQRRQKDVLEFQIPRLQKCQGPLSAQQSIATELRTDIEALARQLESLDLMVGDQREEYNRKGLRRVVDDHRRTLANIRKDARNALLVSKKTIDSQKQSNRAELLRSSAVTEKQDASEQATNDALMNASHNVTSALQRTIGLMQSELEKSVLSHQLLDASTATVRSTSSTYDSLANVMDTSKQLITALEKADWLDRMLIISGLVFFCLVVAFILKQRVIDRSLRIALWWTYLIPQAKYSGDVMIDAMEKAVDRSISASTVLATASTTAAVLGASLTAKSLESFAETSSLASMATVLSDSVFDSPAPAAPENHPPQPDLISSSHTFEMDTAGDTSLVMDPVQTTAPSIRDHNEL